MLPKLFARPHRHCLTLGSRDPWGFLPYRIDLSTFKTHLYCCGRSGSGKSKFLQSIFCELASKGHGCGLIDPHSDLANDCLAYLLAHRAPAYLAKPFLQEPANLARVVYVDLSRTDYLIPCNVLLSSYATPYEVAKNVWEAFRRAYPHSLEEAPRADQIMRNGAVVLIENRLSLVEMPRLLTDEDFRTPLLANVTDPLVGSFFRDEFNRWPPKDRHLMINPVLNKVTDFLFTPSVRYALGAAENRLDMRRILDEGRILIIDLGGFNDDATRRLLGSLILTSLERAAFSRRAQTEAERRPYYFLIDEFPSFLSKDPTTIARILSEARKYRLHLGLGHQTLSQLPGERLQGALENAKLKVIFGTGRQTAETISRAVFAPDTSKVKHEVPDEGQRPRTHPVFESLLEQYENIIQKMQNLRPREILVQPTEESPLIQLRTPTVYDYPASREYLEQLKRHLVQRDGIPVAMG